MKQVKRAISLLLTLSMVLSLVPTAAFAGEEPVAIVPDGAEMPVELEDAPVELGEGTGTDATIGLRVEPIAEPVALLHDESQGEAMASEGEEGPLLGEEPAEPTEDVTPVIADAESSDEVYPAAERTPQDGTR